MNRSMRDRLLTLVLTARDDVRAARLDLGAKPPPIASSSSSQPLHPTTQPVSQLQSIEPACSMMMIATVKVQ